MIQHKNRHSKVIILGAGLTGLTLAYLLKKANIQTLILEARARVGGRIYTFQDQNGTQIEMGATWLGKKHTHLTALLEEFDLNIFEQYLSDRAIYDPHPSQQAQIVALPPNPEPSYRIDGGTSMIIQALLKQLDEEQVLLEQVVQVIDNQGDMFRIQTGQDNFQAEMVVSTLPPNLLLKTVDFKPVLPEHIQKLAQETHTWMGESIKVGLSCPKAFWRNPQSSGTIFSQPGPIMEMYDHSNLAMTNFAIKGFLRDELYQYSAEERKKLALKQLERYYGNQAKQLVSYQDCVWRNEQFTYVAYDQSVFPHQNNGNGLFRKAFLNERFWIAGSETAKDYPGYMDGAVQSAQWVAQEILTKIKEF